MVHDTRSDDFSAAERYEPPMVWTLGTLEGLTAGGGGGSPDGQNGQNGS